MVKTIYIPISSGEDLHCFFCKWYLVLSSHNFWLIWYDCAMKSLFLCFFDYKWDWTSSHMIIGHWWSSLKFLILFYHFLWGHFFPVHILEVLCVFWVLTFCPFCVSQNFLIGCSLVFLHSVWWWFVYILVYLSVFPF